MSLSTSYFIDSNILMTMENLILPPDIFPSVWEGMKDLHVQGKWGLLDIVFKEITRGTGFAAEWIKDSSFVTIVARDEATIRAYTQIIQSVVDKPQYRAAAKEAFANSVDSWIIAFSLAYGKTIVSFEKSAPDCKTNVKIPDVCKEHGIKCIDLNTFFRCADIHFII